MNSPRYDTSRQSAQSPEFRTTSPNREIPATLVGPCLQIVPRRIVRQVLLATPTGKRPRGRPRTRWCDYISDLARYRLSVEPAELCVISVDREVLRVILGLLPPRFSFPKNGFENELNVSHFSTVALISTKSWPVELVCQNVPFVSQKVS